MGQTGRQPPPPGPVGGVGWPVPYNGPRANLMHELSVLNVRLLWKYAYSWVQPIRGAGFSRTSCDPTGPRLTHLCSWLETWRPSAPPMRCSSCPSGAEPLRTALLEMIWCTWTSHPVIWISLVKNYICLKIRCDPRTYNNSALCQWCHRR